VTGLILVLLGLQEAGLLMLGRLDRALLAIYFQTQSSGLSS